MRDQITIVEAAFDARKAERTIQQCKQRMDDAERLAVGAQEKHRLLTIALGNELIEARANCAHGEWLPLLKRCGITSQSASNWMRLAGFVEANSQQNGNVGSLPPTRREAGIDKRKRKAETDEDSESDNGTKEYETERRQPAMPVLDIDRELARLQNKICSFAESVPAQSRGLIAHELRETAKLIEAMK